MSFKHHNTFKEMNSYKYLKAHNNFKEINPCKYFLEIQLADASCVTVTPPLLLVDGSAWLLRLRNLVKIEERICRNVCAFAGKYPMAKKKKHREILGKYILFPNTWRL